MKSAYLVPGGVSDVPKVAKGVAHTEEARQPSCPLCGACEIGFFRRAPDRFHGRKETYNLVRCAKCSGVWLTSPPSSAQMAIHYDADYHRTITEAGEAAPVLRWQPHKQAILRWKTSGAVLDIGCSSGGFLSTMKGSGWRLYGIEIEPSTGDKARGRSGADVFIGEAMEAPYEPETFDVITCFDLLEHVYDPVGFLSKVYEWLKPGGIVYVVLPNIDSWESRIFRSHWYGLELPRHLFHFSPGSLRRLMGSLGFRERRLVTDTAYIERSLGYLYTRLLEKAGFRPAPASAGHVPGIVFRALRKLFRLSVVWPFRLSAATAGAGASIEAIFEKPGAGTQK